MNIVGDDFSALKRESEWYGENEKGERMGERQKVLEGASILPNQPPLTSPDRNAVLLF